MKKIFKLLVVAMSFVFLKVEAKAEINIEGSIAFNEVNLQISNVCFEIYDQYISPKATPPKIVICPIDEKGKFSFSLKSKDKFIYIALYFTNQQNQEVIPTDTRILHKKFLFEDGDSLAARLNVRGRWISFQGRGSEKQNCQYEMASDLMPQAVSSRITGLKNSLNYDENFRFQQEMRDTQRSVQRHILDTYRASLSEEVYRHLYSQIRFEQESYYLKILSFDYSSGIPAQRAAAIRFFDKQYAKDLAPPLDNVSENLSSDYYLYLYKLNWLRVEFDEYPNGHVFERLSMKKFYDHLKKNYSGLTLNNLLLLFFTESGKQQNEVFPFYKNTVYELPEGLQKTFLVKWHKRFTEFRDQDFSLTDVDGNLVKMSSLTGKVLVIDFWFNGCQGCLEMTPSIDKLIQFYKKNEDVCFISVNTDDQKRFKEGSKKGTYTSDKQLIFYTSGLARQHPLLKYVGIDVYPTIIVVGKDGNLISSRAPNPRIDDGAALKRMIFEAL